MLESLFAESRVLDAAVLDLVLPDGNGEALIPAVRRLWPRVRVIVASGNVDDAVAYRLQRAGVMFLPKPITVAVLVVAIEEPRPAFEISEAAVERFGEDFALSGRQRQVLEGLVNGRSRKDIAASLGLSVGTVGAHTTRIYRKTACRSPSDLVRAVVGRAWPR